MAELQLRVSYSQPIQAREQSYVAKDNYHMYASAQFRKSCFDGGTYHRRQTSSTAGRLASFCMISNIIHCTCCVQVVQRSQSDQPHEYLSSKDSYICQSMHISGNIYLTCAIYFKRAVCIVFGSFTSIILLYDAFYLVSYCSKLVRYPNVYQVWSE